MKKRKIHIKYRYIICYNYYIDNNDNIIETLHLNKFSNKTDRKYVPYDIIGQNDICSISGYKTLKEITKDYNLKYATHNIKNKKILRKLKSIIKGNK